MADTIQEKIKEELLSSEENEVGVLIYVEHNDRTNSHVETPYIGTVKAVQFSNKYGNPFPKKSYTSISVDHDSIENYSEFKNNNLTLAQRNRIEHEKAIMEELKERVRLEPEKYSESGILIIDGVKIEVTQKELIEAGINPESFGWISQRDFEAGKKPEVKKEEIVEPELTELIEANGVVKTLRKTIDNIKISDLEKRANKLETGNESDRAEESDTIDENLTKKIKLTRHKEKIDRIVAEIEQDIEVLSNIDLKDLKSKIEEKSKELESKYSYLQPDEINGFGNEKLKSIQALLEIIDELSKENSVSEMISKLQILLQECKQKQQEIDSKLAGLDERTDTLKEKDIREILFGDKGKDVGLRVRVFYNGINETVEESATPGTEKEVILSNKYGIPFPKESYTIAGPMKDSMDRYTEYRSENLSLEQLDRVEQEKARRNALRKDAKQNPDKYSKPGVIVIDGVKIEVTQLELIEAGLDPEIMLWRTREDYENGIVPIGRKEEILHSQKDRYDYRRKKEPTIMQKFMEEVKSAKSLLGDLKYYRIDSMEEEAANGVEEFDENSSSIKISNKLNVNRRLKERIEELLPKLQAINLGNLSSEIENYSNELKQKHSNLTPEQIDLHKDENEMSIQELQQILTELKNEFDVKDIIKKLEEILSKCKDRIKFLENVQEKSLKRENRAHEEEVHNAIFSNEERGLGIIIERDDDGQRGRETVREVAGSRKEVLLSNKYGKPFAKDFYSKDRDGDERRVTTRFKDSELTPEQQEIVNKEIKRREELKRQAEENPSKFSKLGKIVVDGVEIEISQKQMIELGLDPERMGWEELTLSQVLNPKAFVQRIAKKMAKRPDKIAEAKRVVERDMEKGKDEKGGNTLDEQ